MKEYMLENDKRSIKEELNKFMGKEKEVSILEEEGEILFDIIKKNNLNTTLEIGCAIGISTLYIMSATNSKHIVIDPYQETEYLNYGINNLKSSGFENKLKCVYDFSYNALPQLLKERNKFDLVFIDGSHLFDDAFLDFYFSDLLINDFGFIVFHDHTFPSVIKVENWIRNNKKCYENIDVTCHNLSVWHKNNFSHPKKIRFRKWNHYEDF